ncbi:MAG: ribosome maturation factor RimP [Deltaproteobacteria bacterium]|jgi:ribosome maturation factor RimP|nr:ribosome maturation factor RimP [Deltaproteobacteria bacterium]
MGLQDKPDARRRSASGRKKTEATDIISLHKALDELGPKLIPHLEALGLELVSARVISGSGASTVKLVIDRLVQPSEVGSFKGSAVTVDDCALFSRRVSALLDEIYPGDGPAYSLEVSSPGLDRPLKDERDFRRFDGAQVKIKLSQEGRSSNCVGRLISATGPLRLLTDKGEITFGLEDVVSARLVPEI